MPTPTPPWSPAKPATESWDASVSFLQVVAEALIRTVVFFWWLIPILAIAAVTVLPRLRDRLGQRAPERPVPPSDTPLPPLPPRMS